MNSLTCLGLRRSVRAHALILGVALVPGAGDRLWAGVVHDETPNGDLSGDIGAPSALSFALGDNTVSGRFGRPDASVPADADIFSFVVGAGQMVTSIRFDVFDPVTSVGFGGSFFAIDDAATIIADGATQASNRLVATEGELLPLLLAEKRFNDTSFTQDSYPSLLPDPVGAGTYTIWMQELAGFVDYSLTVSLAAAPIPEPATYAALVGAVGLMGACYVRRRRR